MLGFSLKKRVLYISPNGYLGGAERVVLTLAASHLAGDTFEPFILFFSEGEAISEARKSGVNCRVLTSSFRLSHPFKLFKALREIRKIIKTIKPDIIHNTMAYSHLTISMAIIGMKIKTVWFQHGPVGKQLDKLASLFSVNLLFFNSQYLKELHHLSFPKVHIKDHEAIIPLGVSIPPHRREIFNEKNITFGSAGRICEGKSFHYILEVFSLLKKEKMQVPFTLLIAGSAKTEQDKFYHEKLISLVDTFKLNDEVKFLNHVENMESFYQRLDVFIHSTLEPEPFGLVIAEAMANGCLVIGSNQGGVKDLIADKITGLAYSSTEPKDEAINDLKNKIISVILDADKEKFKKMALFGRIFIENNYSIKIMKDTVEALYLKLED